MQTAEHQLVTTSLNLFTAGLEKLNYLVKHKKNISNFFLHVTQ